MRPKDFSRRRHFPGTEGGPFDLVLRGAALVESIPSTIFAVLLLLLALLPTRLRWRRALEFYAFLLGDWALLATLPRLGKSFGPAKPPALVLASLRAIPALLPRALALVAQFIGTALVVYGFWIEPHRLGVTCQRLHSPKLEAGLPLRVLHLGDLHLERITGRERRLIALAKSLAPDLILFSGDFLSYSCVHDPVAWEEARAVLRELSAPLGVFAVTGSPPVDEPEVVARLLRDLPICWLRDERITLEYYGQTFDVIGLTCTHEPFEDGPRLRALIDGRSERFTILLYHTPDLAPEASGAGVDLQLSGHTHGGQVRLPFYGALYTSSLYGKRFESGRYQIGGLTLSVTRGIGLEGKGAPRVRFLCPPEIVLWEISTC